MNNVSDLLRLVSDKEKSSGLYEVKVKNISFWRLVRIPILRSYLLKEYGIGKGDSRNKRNKLTKTSIIKLLKTSYDSFRVIVRTVFFEKRDVDSLILAFPRLQEFDGYYIDRFTDPLIELTNISKSYIIFQRHHAGQHFGRRYNSENTIKTDSIILLASVLGVVILPLIFVLHLLPVFKLYSIANKEFGLPKRAFIRFFLTLSVFIVTKNVYKLLLKRLNIKQVFLVNREIYHPEILACKELNIRTYEIQHGVTHSWTLLYSGLYDEELDVDGFLSFGSYWKGKQFGIPVDKIINIGWAYKQFIDDKLIISEKLEAILVISHSLEDMIDVIESLSFRFFDQKFHIRPHPHESVSIDILRRLKQIDNVELLSNKTESIAVLNSYASVLGVSSTVLFEALALNLKVGVLNMGECMTNIPLDKLSGVFSILNTLNDFEDFISSTRTNRLDTSEYYGIFDSHQVNKLLL